MARRLFIPGLVLGVALLVRLAGWSAVFTDRGVSFPNDSDPHYHVLRTERMLRGGPGAPWRDPALDWPAGADIPWPPLFDALVAGAARLTGAPPDREGLATVAALLPVLLGLLILPVVAAIGRTALGRGRGWIAAFLVAATSVGADHSRLGRADQHALELLLFALLLLLTLRAPRATRWPAAAACVALLVTAAFWTWMGSALHLLVVLAVGGAVHQFTPDGADAEDRLLPTLAAGLAGAAALLAATTAALGPPSALARASTTGVGLLQVAVCAAGALSAAALAAARRRWAARTFGARAALLAIPLLPPLLLLAFPPIRDGIAGGLVALAAANPWYAAIGEFQPALGAGEGLATELLALARAFGLVLLVAPFGLPALSRKLRDPDRRAAALGVLVTLALLVPLAFARRRFAVYALLPLAVCAEQGLRSLLAIPQTRVRRLLPASVLLAAGAIATAAPSIPEHLLQTPPLSEEEVLLLRWAGDLPRASGREGVLAPWSLGHVIQYYAGRPVLTSPFGTEGGPLAMEDAAAFWFAPDEPTAEALLSRRRCGLVLLGFVPPETQTLHGFAPAGTERPLTRVRSLWRRERIDDTDAFWRLIPTRLYYEDGAAARDRPSLAAFRLLAETPATSPDDAASEAQWKLFEPVAGARVRTGAGGGRPVRATVRLETNTGRRFEWSAEAPAGGELRLPYASGANGAVIASEWTLSDGSRSLAAVVHEEEVREGARFEVDLARGTVVRLAAGQALSDGAAGPGAASGSRSSARTTRSNSSSKSTR